MTTATSIRRGQGQAEFVALMAMLAATVAFSIDAMLPALPEIGSELSPEAPNRAQLIVTSFVLGMGLGTFVFGPVSDRVGRKPAVIGGSLLYVAGSALAALAPSMELMLAARLLQGFGAAAPRVISVAIIRDRQSGREMARTLSFVMLVFALVPAIAPTLGYGIIALGGWRVIFVAFLVFAVLTMTWLALRLPETLPPDRRRPLRAGPMLAVLAEMAANPTSRLATLALTLTFGMLFTTLSSTQPIFDITYGEGDRFHLWFGAIAIVAAGASVTNAWLVLRVGMRAILRVTFAVQVALSSTMALAVLLPLPDLVEFAVFVLWTTSIFFQAGLTLGNLNALGLEPMGHAAGLAASTMTALGTVGAVLIAVPIGLAFDGTPLPAALGTGLCACLAWAAATRIRREGD